MPSRVQPKSCNEFSAEVRVPGNDLARSERVGNALLDEIARVGLKRAGSISQVCLSKFREDLQQCHAATIFGVLIN